MTIKIPNDAISFETESAAVVGDLLGAETDAWRKRQCVDKMWWKFICSKNLRGNLSQVKLRFVLKGETYSGRAVFSILVGLSLSLLTSDS